MQQTNASSGVHRMWRWIRHRWADLRVGHHFPAPMVHRLTERIEHSERRHDGQLCLCVEGGLPSSYLWRGASARERAITLFGKMRVWDTEANNGVLLYVLLAEHAVELVADRGVCHMVPNAQWRLLIERVRSAFERQQYEQGLEDAIAEATALLSMHFPAPSDTTAQEAPRRNEIDDRPRIGR